MPELLLQNTAAHIVKSVFHGHSTPQPAFIGNCDDELFHSAEDMEGFGVGRFWKKKMLNRTGTVEMRDMVRIHGSGWSMYGYILTCSRL